MKLTIEANKVTISTRSKFPFLEEDLEREVEAAGFTRPKRGGTVLIARRDGSQSLGQVWSKDDFTITYDPNRGFLSLEGADPATISEEFGQLVHIERELLAESFSEEIEWGELNFAARASTERLPLEVFGKYSTELHEGLGDVFGESIDPYSITGFSTPSKDSRRALNEVQNWFDIRIEPLIANPKYYFIRIVYRQNDLSMVEGFVKELEGRLEKAIRLLEEVS